MRHKAIVRGLESLGEFCLDGALDDRSIVPGNWWEETGVGVGRRGRWGNVAGVMIQNGRLGVS